MKRALVSSLAIASLFVASSAFAGTQDNAKIALTLHTLNTKNQCTTNAPQNLACSSVDLVPSSNLVVNGAVGVSYAMYIVALDINTTAGLAGASFGIAYDGAAASGMDVYSWNLCADQEFAGNGWPDAGGGNVITYASATNCQNTPDASDPEGEGRAVLGWAYVYAYSPDVCSITKREYIPVPDFAVADCAASESSLPLTSAGAVGFGLPGIDPCYTPGTPVENTTWGGIKKLD